MTVEVLFQCTSSYEAPDDEDEPTPSTSTTRLRTRLLESECAIAFEAFQVAYASASGRLSSMDADPGTWVYPRVRVLLAIPGVEEGFAQDVVLDGSLFAQLVAIYTGFGWQGVEAVRAAATFVDSEGSGVRSPSSVTEDEVQAAVSDYAKRAIRAVANLVYDGLVHLEQCLKRRAIASLTLVSGRVNVAFKSLKMQPRQVSARPTFKFSNQDPAYEKDIHFALTRFAKAYRSVLALAAKQTQLQSRLKEIPVEALLTTLASDMPVAGTDEVSVARALEEAQQELARVESQKVSDTKVMEGLSAGITTYFPAAVPVCLWINPGDNATTVTNKLGQFYWEMGRRTDRLKAEIPTESLFVHKTSRRAVYRQPDVIENVAFNAPPGGLEALVAQEALSSRASSIDAQMLSDMDAIEMLLGSNAVPPGSVEYAVGCHYLHILCALLAQREAERASEEANLQAASRFSSALSLMSLVPALRPLAGVVTVIDMVLFAKFAMSSAELLQQMELDVDQGLMRETTATFQGLSELAALIDQRKRMVAQLDEEAVKQLVLMGAGQVRFVRGALAARSYYMDLENVLGAS